MDWRKFFDEYMFNKWTEILMLLVIIMFSIVSCSNNETALRIAENANNVSESAYKLAETATNYLHAEKRPRIELSIKYYRGESKDPRACHNFIDSDNLWFELKNYGKLPAECVFKVEGNNIYCRNEGEISEDKQERCEIKNTVYYEAPQEFKFRIYGNKQLKKRNKEIWINISYECREPSFNFEIPSEEFRWEYGRTIKEYRNYEDLHYNCV